MQVVELRSQHSLLIPSQKSTLEMRVCIKILARESLVITRSVLQSHSSKRTDGQSAIVLACQSDSHNHSR